MLSTVEELVIQYQEKKDSDVFTEIYMELLPMKNIIVKKLRKRTPVAISDAEVETFFDDAVFHGAARFDATKGCSFNTFIYMVAEDMRRTHIRKLNAVKREADATAVSIDALATDSSETRIVDLIADDTAVDPMDVLAGSEMLESLKEFMAQSPKNYTAGTLIALDTVYFSTRDEKHAAMQKALGTELTTSGMHKKIQRAKTAFKKFLAEK